MLAGILIVPSADGAAFIKGVDLSILKAAEDGGIQYKLADQVRDPIVIFKENGCNYVRLRLFVNPSGKDGQVNTLQYTLALAKRVKQAGLKLLLDFHYSDGWADPKSQEMPVAWQHLDRAQLIAKVHDYTLETLRSFDAQGCLPDMVAVGNELSNGFMWPAGGPMTSDTQWPQLIELLKAGIAGVRDAASPDRIKIMIHLDRGDSERITEWFYGHCEVAKLDYDVIGLSFYPYSGDSLDDLSRSLKSLSTKYHKDIIIAETSYSFTGEQGKLPYPTDPDGQKAFLDRLMRVVAETPQGHGAGVFYWEAAWVGGKKWNAPNWSSDWENRALFDADGNALPAIASYWCTDPLNPPGSQVAERPRSATDAITPAINFHYDWWTQRHESLKQLVARHPGSQLIFVGDSITDLWQYQPSFEKLYGKYDAIDLGISGDRTENVLYRIENGELDGLHPKVAVVLIGTNNTPIDRPEWIAAGVSRIVEVLHQKLPQTKVLVLSLFPRGHKDDKLRPVVNQVNELLQAIRGPTTKYLDIGDKFLDSSGDIPRDIMKDLLHPTAKGYDIWANAMQPTLDALMK